MTREIEETDQNPYNFLGVEKQDMETAERMTDKTPTLGEKEKERSQKHTEWRMTTHKTETEKEEDRADFQQSKRQRSRTHKESQTKI